MLPDVGAGGGGAFGDIRNWYYPQLDNRPKNNQLVRQGYNCCRSVGGDLQGMHSLRPGGNVRTSC